MTIEANGRVEKMEIYADGKQIALYIKIDGARSEGESLLLKVSREEARQYQPGDAVTLQIRPAPQPGDSRGS